MSIEFDQENSFNKTFSKAYSKSGDSKIVAYLIKKRFAKNEKQANMILLGIAVLCILLTLSIIKTTVYPASAPVSQRTREISQTMSEYRKAGLPLSEIRKRIAEDIQSGKIK
ncbi:MAG: hypothetical protein WC229_01460 [Candidatus Paceibacterota bacterium]|jgi:hypothetical protein